MSDRDMALPFLGLILKKIKEKIKNHTYTFDKIHTGRGLINIYETD